MSLGQVMAQKQPGVGVGGISWGSWFENIHHDGTGWSSWLWEHGRDTFLSRHELHPLGLYPSHPLSPAKLHHAGVP